MKRNPAFMDEIVSYIKNNLKKGYTKESLRWALIDQGYSKLEVEKALQRADLELAQEAPALRTKPEIKYEAVPIGNSEKKARLKTTKGLGNFWRDLFGF